MTYIKSDEFCDICYEHNFDPHKIKSALESLGKAPSLTQVTNRIANYRRKGLLPLDSGNKVDSSTVLRGTSTLFDSTGVIKQQWIKSDVPKEDQLKSLESAIESLVDRIPSKKPTTSIPATSLDTSITTYVSNDLHFGAMMSKEYNHGRDWDLKIARDTASEAINYLVGCAPATEECIVVDLGDLLEMDSYDNMTRRSGNILDVDGRWDKAIEFAIDIMEYFIEKALTKHKTVHFYNIAGNHDDISAVAVKLAIYKSFKNEPRVKVDLDRRGMKYHLFGSTALFFAHGHSMKMGARAESCAIADLREMKVLDRVNHIYGLFGHNHKDSVYDGANTKQESFRNLPSQNVWATDSGYRRQAGTMKSIVYDKEFGEVSRNTFNVSMAEQKPTKS